jgi:dihydropyrimidine dehydrogenase (NAD+) subunit PreA
MLKDPNGKPYLQVREEDCVGCNLCSIVCPVEDAITMVELPHEQLPMTWNDRQSALGLLKQLEVDTVK